MRKRNDGFLIAVKNTIRYMAVTVPVTLLEGELDYPLSVFLAGVMENNVAVQSVCGLLCLLPVTFFFLYYHKEPTDGLRDMLWS